MKTKSLWIVLLSAFLLFMSGCGGGQGNKQTSPSTQESPDETPSPGDTTEPESTSEPVNDIDVNNDGTIDSLDEDTDGDGLTNKTELIIGTSPEMADTDGDSYDDLYEYLLNKTLDPDLSFHPLIPDIPDFRVEMAGPPHLYMVTSESESFSESITSTTSESYDRTKSISSSSSNSFSNEVNFGLRVWAQTDTQAGLGTNILGIRAVFGAEGSVNYSHSTNETYSWGQTDTTNVGQRYEEAVSRAQENGWTLSGAVLEIPVRLYNPSPISYKVTSLLMNASKIGYGGKINEGKQMTFADEQGLGTGITLAPKGESGDQSGLLTYKVAIDSAEEAKNYIAESTGVMAIPSGYVIEYTNAQTGITHDFTGVMTDVANRTARIMIDPGPTITVGERSKLFDKRIVALPKLNPNPTSSSDMYRNLTLAEALKALGIEYEMGQWLVDSDASDIPAYWEVLESFGYSYGDLEQWVVENNITVPAYLTAETNVTAETNTTLADFCTAQGGCSPVLGVPPVNKEWRTGIVSLDGIEQDLSKRSFWLIALTKASSGTTYYIGAPIGSYNPANITIAPKDVVSFIFSEDADGDGVPARVEIQNQSSDDTNDSDGDGLNDNLEFYGWCRGGLNDTPVQITQDIDGRIIGACEGKSVFYTRAGNDDTDWDDTGDGSLNDYNDPEPLTRFRNEQGTIAKITLQHNYGSTAPGYAYEKTLTQTAPGTNTFEADAASHNNDYSWMVKHNQLNWTIETNQTVAGVSLIDPISGQTTLLTQDSADPRKYVSSSPVNIYLGFQQEWTIRVQAEAGETTDYTIRMDSPPGYFNTTLDSTESVRFVQNVNADGSGMDITARLYDATDPRIEGALVAICENSGDLSVSLENISDISALQSRFPSTCKVEYKALSYSSGGTITGSLFVDKRNHAYATRTYTYGRFDTGSDYVFSYATRTMHAANPPKMTFTVKLTRVYNNWLTGGADWYAAENGFQFGLGIATGTETYYTQLVDDTWYKQKGGYSKTPNATYDATVTDLSWTAFTIKPLSHTPAYWLLDAGVAYGSWMYLGTGDEWNPNTAWTETKTVPDIVDTSSYKSSNPKSYNIWLNKKETHGLDEYGAALQITYEVTWKSAP